jgi:hypothetical protein
VYEADLLLRIITYCWEWSSEQKAKIKCFEGESNTWPSDLQSYIQKAFPIQMERNIEITVESLDVMASLALQGTQYNYSQSCDLVGNGGWSRLAIMHFMNMIPLKQLSKNDRQSQPGSPHGTILGQI